MTQIDACNETPLVLQLTISCCGSVRLQVRWYRLTITKDGGDTGKLCNSDTSPYDVAHGCYVATRVGRTRSGAIKCHQHGLRFASNVSVDPARLPGELERRRQCVLRTKRGLCCSNISAVSSALSFLRRSMILTQDHEVPNIRRCAIYQNPLPTPLLTWPQRLG